MDDDEDASANGGGAVRPTPLGRVASLYYLQHTTAALIAERFRGLQLTHTEVREEAVGAVWCWPRGDAQLCGYCAVIFADFFAGARRRGWLAMSFAIA